MGIRVKLAVGAVLTALVAGVAPPAAASAPAVQSVTSVQGAFGPLGPLADLSVRRALLGDKVAAAKFGTTQPIDDPVREKQVLDQVAAESVRLGLPPETSVRFFRAQIEANKTVQRGLFKRWQEHPSEAPTERPDLATEVRPLLNQITGQILEQLLATRDIRDGSQTCLVWHKLAEVSGVVINRLDRLHRDAVAMAMRPVCQP
jgi:chorismate mutase